MKKMAKRTVILLGYVFCLWTLVQADQRFPTLNHLKTGTSPADQQVAVEDLIFRVIGTRSSEISVFIKPIGKNGQDAFQLETVANKLQITGTTGVAAAMGFYYYLKTYCRCQVTWGGQQLNLPSVLIKIPSPGITVPVNDRYRYYQNVCTVSYSFAWFNWTQWEKQIDWMAMQGINLPLAFTGQEAIFQRVFLNLGFTIEDMGAFFGGPAFLAWARMGNIQGWGGPLPQSWIANQLALQHSILKRMRSLGMIPVLPGFAGFVPAAIKRVFPNASVTRESDWGNFGPLESETYLLNFQDPLFKKIGSALITEMMSEFGVDHIYNADTFNEMTPSSRDPAYLASAGRAVYEAMTAADPQAIWLMQGWLFMETSFWQPPQIQALLQAVPQGRMIILDLESDLYPIYNRTQSFYGQPFIWNMLHNFGGTMPLYGALEKVNNGPSIARQFPNSSMVGIGLTPEGIFQNEVVYEFMMEQSWRPGPVNISRWISDFAVNRYGLYNADIDAAWQLLKTSVYNLTSGKRNFGHTILTARPSLYSSQDVWFEPSDLYKAWGHLVKVSSLGNSTLFRYDVVDVTRDCLVMLLIPALADIVQSYHSGNFSACLRDSAYMTELLEDLETLLASDSHFLLGNWIASARALASNDAEKKLYEYNARNQITLWGPKGNILDYAVKQWSGLVKDYYKPRWELFIIYVLQAVEQKQSFNEVSYQKDVFSNVETPFTWATNNYPVTPSGDSLLIAQKLYAKYEPLLTSTLFKKMKTFNTSDALKYSWKFKGKYGSMEW